ncbi:hypothetical protein B0I03_101232 [Flavobacterium aquaticum]|jgi:hypothetical protein|uniref:YolD-like protein n=1 Tax=Flavobacterium aquaticum TaxID=1236486 RepID=A0A327YW63_9FLAO|nr:hypothetical protein [Flavobacterium aquaticum]RAK25072.1 hypothetical protein B0I03_101232 [Flavobacterium aquaticum]TXI63420.1 MAG: hypothetical protein E6Q46_07970 [Flavobacterium sp.]
MDSAFELIDKELITSLNFPKTDVLEDKEAILGRKNDLDRALSLGNLEHVKIQIYFEDDMSKKMVETTIWGVTDERVILKQGVVIPVKRIHKIV